MYHWLIGYYYAITQKLINTMEEETAEGDISNNNS